MNRLEEIISQIQINSEELWVSHPHYCSISIQTEIKPILQSLPQQVQDTYLSALLTELIFGISRNDQTLLRKNRQLKVDYEIESSHLLNEIDWQFYDQIHQSNHGKGWRNSQFVVVQRETDEQLVVQKKGINIQIQPNYHLREAERSANVGDQVSVLTPSSQITAQFYTAFGDATTVFSDAVTLVYFNVNSQGAISAQRNSAGTALMRSLTQQLNQKNISFIFHLLYNPSFYQRYDSGILRFNKAQYDVVHPILESVYEENKANFQSQVPLLTKMLAPGLGLAEKPNSFIYQHLDDFGRHRCEVIASALLAAHRQGEDSLSARMIALHELFSTTKISLEHPYLNPGSEDIYGCLASIGNGF